MKFFGKWLRFQNKRLYKKPVFLAILLAIPLFTLAVSLLATEESGLFRICLAGVREGTLSEQVAENLRGGSELLLFTVAESEDAARDAVRTGDADAAWIFPEDLEEALKRFALPESDLSNSRSDKADPLSGSSSPKADPPNAPSYPSSASRPAVTVFVREQTIPLRLAGEKLAGALYETCGKALFLSYLRSVLPEDAAHTLSDAELLQFYDGFENTAPLFLFETSDQTTSTGGTAATGSAGARESYLLAPVRGFLATLTVLAGFAAALFVRRDEETGAFALLSPGKRPFAGLSVALLATLNTGAASLIALWLSGVGITVSLSRELFAMAIYSVCCAAYGILWARLVPHPAGLSALLPLFAICMIGICPIFFSLKSLDPIAMLFPPTWYLHSFYSTHDLLTFLACTACVGVFAIIFSFLRMRCALHAQDTPVLHRHPRVKGR